MRLLDKVNKIGTTVVMATHDQAIVDAMRKRVIELDTGQGRPRPVPRGVLLACAGRVYFRETASGLRSNGTVAFAAMSTAFIALFLFGLAAADRPRVRPGHRGLHRQRAGRRLPRGPGQARDGGPAQGDCCSRSKPSSRSSTRQEEAVRAVQRAVREPALGHRERRPRGVSPRRSASSSRDTSKYEQITAALGCESIEDGTDRVPSRRRAQGERLPRAARPALDDHARAVARRARRSRSSCSASAVALGREHAADGDVRSAQGDRHHAAGGRHELAHPHAVPDRGAGRVARRRRVRGRRAVAGQGRVHRSAPRAAPVAAR